jgi:hypothetical protein
VSALPTALPAEPRALRVTLDLRADRLDCLAADLRKAAAHKATAYEAAAVLNFLAAQIEWALVGGSQFDTPAPTWRGDV